MAHQTILEELDEGFRVAIKLLDQHLARCGPATWRLAGFQDGLTRLEKLYLRWLSYAATNGGQDLTILEARLFAFLTVGGEILQMPLTDDEKLRALQNECRRAAKGFSRDDRRLRREMLQSLLSLAKPTPRR
ncbi:MAG: hypothetical protein HY340_00915 [Candidatus Kerfeldbacteria bacterium]|nr:hypothetical protein [Candidatus Kerfeldbacteria bacterium]